MKGERDDDGMKQTYSRKRRRKKKKVHENTDRIYIEKDGGMTSAERRFFIPYEKKTKETLPT